MQLQALARVLAPRLRALVAAGAAHWVSAGRAAAAANGTAVAAAGQGSTAGQAALLFGRSALLYAACDGLAAAAHHPHVSGADCALCWECAGAQAAGARMHTCVCQHPLWCRAALTAPPQQDCTLGYFQTLSTSPAACVQVLLAGSATAAVAAAARWGLARAAVRQSAGAASTALLPAAVQGVLERTGARALVSGQAQLPAHIVLPTLAAAHASARMLTFNVLGLHSVANHTALQGWLQQEEVPLSGRLRPAMPVLTYDEKAARQDPAPCAAMLLKMGFPGAPEPASVPWLQCTGWANMAGALRSARTPVCAS